MITSSLSTILCDCLTEDDDNTTCYSDTDATTIEVGFRDVCAGEVMELKGPSNSIVFDETAVIDRCTKATLSLIRRSAFAVSRSTASVSFQFDTPAKPGVVLNQKGATIGKLYGDGASLTFEQSLLVSHFRACLRITVEGDVKGVRDFGYTTGDIIYPLDISDSIEVRFFFVVYVCGKHLIFFLFFPNHRWKSEVWRNIGVLSLNETQSQQQQKESFKSSPFLTTKTGLIKMMSPTPTQPLLWFTHLVHFTFWTSFCWLFSF